jgi:soluble lytic murein transglycosylase-like protein
MKNIFREEKNMKRSAYLRKILNFSLIINLLLMTFLLSSIVYSTNKSSLLELLDATASKEQAVALDRGHLSTSKHLKDTEPMWPIQTFLLAEVYRLRGEKSEARNNYRTVAEWANKDPYNDEWGGSGIVLVCLWRWLNMIRETPLDKNEADNLFSIWDNLKDTRLLKSMLSDNVLTTLPQIGEDTHRLIAYLAWDIGDKNRARTYFLEYLEVAGQTQLDPTGEKLMDDIVSSAGISRDSVKLIRAKGLYSLINYDEAHRIFDDLRNSKDLSIRAEAGLYIAHIMDRRKIKSRTDIISLLDSVLDDASDPDIAQEALYLRAKENGYINVKEYLNDLKQLVNDFPRGHLHADALNRLANYYVHHEDIDNVLMYSEKLRNYKGENNWKNSAFFVPAIALYGQKRQKEAYELLDEFRQNKPQGEMISHTLFWLGRIAAEEGKHDAARKYFEELINTSPFNYYAIRARMHLAGKNASSRLWPQDKIYQELNRAFKKSFIAENIKETIPYHIRIKQALQTGLYKNALGSEQSLRKRYPSKRIEILPIEKIDTGMLTGLSILLALRQDALAANDSVSNPANRLQIAGKIGNISHDWEFVLNLVLANGERFNYLKRRKAQLDTHYLATAYPPVFREIIMKSNVPETPPELIYSIMRRESMFNLSALSINEALGLFQFTPKTFRTLNKKWRLVPVVTGTKSWSEKEARLLTDPEQSMQAGARYLKEELINKFSAYKEKHMMFAIMAHNAGHSTVEGWIKTWKNSGHLNDVEYMMDTIYYGQTRVFTRRVIADMVLVEASGMFKDNH